MGLKARLKTLHCGGCSDVEGKVLRFGKLLQEHQRSTQFYRVISLGFGFTHLQLLKDGCYFYLATKISL